MNHDEFAAAVRQECEAVAELLIRKNREYGNSALEPIRIFACSDPVEQIRVRIDDKLSRIARGHGSQEDTVMDLIGYCIIMRIALRAEAEVGG